MDERFSPAQPPALDVQTRARRCTPVARARDETGRDVTDARRTRATAGIVATFERGAYQGIARGPLRRGRARPASGADAQHVLVAHGWIYPTDSSINVAIGQGGARAAERAGPRSAEIAGRWRVVRSGPRLPGGQEQDDPDRPERRLAGATGGCGCGPTWRSTGIARRWPSGVERARRGRRGSRPSSAELRYRGFSQTRRRRAATRPRCRSTTDRQRRAALARPGRLPHAVRRRARAARAGRRSLRDHERRRRAAAAVPGAARPRRRAGRATSC